MSFIDIVILAGLAASLIAGFMKGGLQQIGGIAGIIFGTILAKSAGSSVGVLILKEGSSETMAAIAGGITVFIAVYLGCMLLTRLLSSILSGIGLGAVNRVAGAIVMAAKFLLIASIILNLVYLIKPDASLLSDTTLKTNSFNLITSIKDIFPMLIG